MPTRIPLSGPVRTWALVSGVTGIAGNLALVLFYAVATPWQPGEAYAWLGPLNDVLVLAQFAALAVVLAGLRQPTVAGSEAWVTTGVAAALLVVVLQGLLVAGVLPFAVQVVLLAPCAVTAVWATGAVSARAASAGVVPAGLARFARMLGIGLPAGIAVLLLSVGVATVLGLGWTAWVLGSLPAVLVWFAFPFWALRLARSA